MDIFSWLRHDHSEILGLLGEGSRGAGAETAGAEAWSRGVGRWDIHARIEENFLFPLLKSESGLRHTLARTVQAHDRIRARMRDLSPPDRDAEAWAGRAAGLLEILERLQDMKERRIFPCARKTLSRDESEELGSEVQDFLHGLESALAAGPLR
jgi:hypothetical protein